MKLKGGTINLYTGAFVVTVVGAGAALLILDTLAKVEPIDYSNIDSVLETKKL